MPFILQTFPIVNHTLHLTCLAVKKKLSDVSHINMISFKLFGTVDKTFIAKYFLGKR